MATLAVPGCVLHYDIVDRTLPWIDAPETIVFHHGLGASSGTWAQWFTTLSERYKIVTFDMRGHGKSEHPQSNDALSLDQLADDLFAVADAARIGKFHLVGESIGGTVALVGALRRPDRVSTLTISNGAHVGGTLQNLDNWKQIIDREGMQGWSRQLMGMRFFDGALDEAMARWYEKQQAGVSADFVLRAVRLLVGADLSSRLDALTLPVLLLHGDSSPFIPVTVMADLRARLKNARMQVFQRAKHGLPFSHAKQCAEALRAFLLDNTQALH